ncbi:hypothetical protein BKI52_25235 [marine bacterium AO1-C]|nr:hypothetical protein BKI52_25235 [marine bacterium AO1-C]
MGQAEPVKTHYSYEEYLALEQQDGIRYEYYQGEVFAMAGGTKRHNRISKNLVTALDSSLGDDCESFIGYVKVEIFSQGYYVYPDVVVTCDPQDLEDDQKAFIRNPSLIIEVLSKSTQNYGKEHKKDAYMRLPALEYYVLVSQEQCLVKLYERRQDFWAYTFYDDANQSITFPKLNLTLKVGDIYKRVNFEKPKA